MKPNILIFDIENTPLVSYNWGLYEQNTPKLLEEWYFLCFGYKWYGQKSVTVERLKDGKKSERELIVKLWNLFDKADIIVAHNGKSFDIKKANAKFIEYGLKPPSPYQIVDTKVEAKKYARFTSNKLDDLGELLKIGRKVKHEGIEMWHGCMNGEEKWWKLMLKYNKQDVVLLEKLYEILIPWMTQRKVTASKKKFCPYCGSLNTQKRGSGPYKGSMYHRHQCLSCVDHPVQFTKAGKGRSWFYGDKEKVQIQS